MAAVAAGSLAGCPDATCVRSFGDLNLDTTYGFSAASGGDAVVAWSRDYGISPSEVQLNGHVTRLSRGGDVLRDRTLASTTPFTVKISGVVSFPNGSVAFAGEAPDGANVESLGLGAGGFLGLWRPEGTVASWGLGFFAAGLSSDGSPINARLFNPSEIVLTPGVLVADQDGVPFLT